MAVSTDSSSLSFQVEEPWQWLDLHGRLHRRRVAGRAAISGRMVVGGGSPAAAAIAWGDAQSARRPVVNDGRGTFTDPEADSVADPRGIEQPACRTIKSNSFFIDIDYGVCSGQGVGHT